MDFYKEKLSLLLKDEQQKIAYENNGNTVVIAGPGSGKTSVLTLKIMKLLSEDISPPRGLACLTFSKDAAKEFIDRLNLLGYKKRKNVFLGTVHAFCIAEIITPFAHLYDYGIPLPVKLVSQREKSKLFKEVLSDIGISQEELTIEEMDRERRLNIGSMSNVIIPSYDVALKAAKEYEERLHATGFLDFEDVVNFATLLIQNETYVRKCIEAKFPWILIDEYQDLGKPLHEMILSLYSRTNIKIFAVGDPDQSIYGFTGAFPDFLTELSVNNNFITIELKNNYRSNQDIIDASELGLNESRNYVAGKRIGEPAEFTFITCDNGMLEQYEAVAKYVIPKSIKAGISFNDIAIIVGKREELRDLRKVLEENNIPVYVSKHEFERTDLIVWIEKCAKWSLNRTNESFDEISGYWIELLREHGRVIINSQEEMNERIKIYDILSAIWNLEEFLQQWVTEFIKRTGIHTLLRNSASRPDELDNLQTFYKSVKQGELVEYNLQKLAHLGEPNNQVTVTTRHSSKGLEFEVVVLLGMEEGRFPFYKNFDNPKKLAEEHRVFFVCLSRAKRVCYLLHSCEFTFNGRYGPYSRGFVASRFWNTIFWKYGGAWNSFNVNEIIS